MGVKYFLAWFGMMILAILNGGFRDLLYKPLIGDLAAHQLSTLILLILFGIYLRILTSLWPIVSFRQAWWTGVMWLVMTLAFEIGLGRWGLGYHWSRIFHDYAIMEGRIWVLIPVWTLVGPYVFFRFGQQPNPLKDTS